MGVSVTLFILKPKPEGRLQGFNIWAQSTVIIQMLNLTNLTKLYSFRQSSVPFFIQFLLLSNHLNILVVRKAIRKVNKPRN